ncbi:MAG: sce7725 family protein [Balneolaceae bacterium]|nr:sce7725 family protein [Balneolaceae bacterium]
MYLPYLRGKQFELIALRELAESMGETGVIHPVIEPVKESISTLRLTVEQLKEHNVTFTIIINPDVGDFSDDHLPVAEFIDEYVVDYNEFNVGVLLQQNTDLGILEAYLNNLEHDYSINVIHKGRFPDMDWLQNFLEQQSVGYNLFRDPTVIRRYRRLIDNTTKVILSDPFNTQPTNADYANNTDEFFSDEHNFYEEDGFLGFSDYVTIGEDYSDGGFAPYAVAIHLTYEKDKGQIWIRHFVSDTNEDYTDVPGTYSEALKKLIEYIDIHQEKFNTVACNEFREHYRTGHYPGLGSVKKLSIKHHIELITSILTR